jgi:hypothetical protein
MAQLRELEIEFQAWDEADKEVMIINAANISYEICPKYPEFSEFPALWQEITGTYDLLRRLPSGDMGSEVFGQDEIRIEDGVLLMPGVIGPIKPISDTEIVILSGSFAGEIMLFEPDSGYVYHQSIVYQPAKS